MWKYCGSISQLIYFYFLYYFSFYSIHSHLYIFISFFLFLFSCFSPPHTCLTYLYPPHPFFYFLFLPHIQEHSSSFHSLSLEATERTREKKEAMEMREKEEEATKRMKEKKKSRWERNNWYNSSWYNFLIKKIQLLTYSSPSDLMSYYSWAKKNSRFK